MGNKKRMIVLQLYTNPERGSQGSVRAAWRQGLGEPPARSAGWSRARLWEAEQTNRTDRDRPQGDKGRPWRRGRTGFLATETGAKTMFALKP